MVTVSVIIPNYNHAPFLKQRIESVINQDFQDFEIIILDDCSTDASREIIQAYQKHLCVSKIIYNKVNSGSTFSQWQKGIAAAKGTLIWIAESDDMATPDFLSFINPLFQSNSKLGLAYSQSYRLNAAGAVIGNWCFHTEDLDQQLWLSDFSMDGREFAKKYLLYKNPIPNASAVVFKKSLYEQVGGADTRYKINGDWYLYSKILAVCDLAFVSKPLNYFREHENKGSAGNILNGTNVKEYYQLINVWKSLFKIGKQHLDGLLKNAFHYWCITFSGSVMRMLQINFLNIFQSAFKVDKLIVVRLIKYAMGS